MMHFDDKIEFQAERDFGGRLNAAFDFIRRNFLPLLSSMLVVILPLLAVGGALGLLLFRYLQATQLSTNDGSMGIVLTGFIFFAYYLLVASFLPAAVVYSYIKLYRERPEQVFTIEQVLGELKHHWLSLLGAMLLIYVMLVPAFVLFIIPGIYIAVPLAFVPYIIVMEDLSITDSIARAFRVVKNYWWETLALIIVATIIGSLFSYIFQLPFTILFGAMPFIADSGDITSLGIWGILAAVLYLTGSFIVQALPLTIYAFHYHHLVELKEGTGLMGRIANLGNQAGSQRNYKDEEETF